MARLMGLCVFLLSLLVAATVIWNLEQHRREFGRAEVLNKVDDHAQALQLNILQSVSATYALAALVRHGHGSLPDFDTVARDLLPHYPAATILTMAPAGVIRSIAPLAGNEEIIGLDLLTDPATKTEAAQARDTGKLVLAGPLQLAHGGLAAIAVLPVFLDAGADGKPLFWGFINVVIRFPDALVGAHLPEFQNSGFNYDLWRAHPQTGRRQNIASSSSTALSEPVNVLVELPYGNWTLSAAPARGWGDPPGLALKALIGLSSSLLLAYVAVLVTRLRAHQGKLEEEVAQRTQALAVANSDLASREALLKQVLNTSSVAIFLVDLQGRITQTNQRMAQMFGYSMETLLGLEYVALVKPAEREVARQKMLALLASDVPAVESDRLYWRADKTEFWGHLSGKRFTDADGKEHGLIGVIIDITERKTAEKTLQQHDNMMSTIIENFPGGISMMDADLRLTAYNKQFKQLLEFPDSLFEKPDLNLEDIMRFNAQRGEYGPGDVESQVATRVERARKFEPHRFERQRPNGRVLEIYGEPVPGGGFITAYLDITERKQLEEEVRQLAFYDPLTKLPNRRLLYEHLGQSIVATKRCGYHGALMFLDLDNFKALNDTHGHGAGDLLLIEVAHRLRSCVREIDTVARLGGDEFVVIVGDLSQDKAESTAQANVIARKIQDALSAPYLLAVKHDDKAVETVEHRCSASMGVVVFIDSEGTQEDFLRWADAAMYKAKETGSSLIRFSEVTGQAQTTANNSAAPAIPVGATH